jgi:hypothetical protein
MNHTEKAHPQTSHSGTSTSADFAIRSPRTRRLTNPNLSTVEYNEALALYLRLRQSLVGI